HRRLELAGLPGGHAEALRHEVGVGLALSEAGLWAVVGHPGGHPIAVTEDLALVRQLQRDAPVLRAGLRRSVLGSRFTLQGASERIAGAVHDGGRRARTAT